MYHLVIKSNINGITFIDLYKGESNLPELSFVCKFNYEIKNALAKINDLNIRYEIIFEILK